MPEDEKTLQRFHFYSPTSAAGSRGVYYVPPTFLPRRGCINLRQISQGDGTSPTFKIHSTRHHPTCACGGRGAIEMKPLRGFPVLRHLCIGVVRGFPPCIHPNRGMLARVVCHVAKERHKQMINYEAEFATSQRKDTSK